MFNDAFVCRNNVVSPETTALREGLSDKRGRTDPQRTSWINCLACSTRHKPRSSNSLWNRLPDHYVQGTMLPWKVTKLQESLRDMRVLDDVDAVEHTVALVENDVTNLVFEEEFVRPNAGCTARRAWP